MALPSLLAFLNSSTVKSHHDTQNNDIQHNKNTTLHSGAQNNALNLQCSYADCQLSSVLLRFFTVMQIVVMPNAIIPNVEAPVNNPQR